MTHQIYRDPLKAIGNREDTRVTNPDDTEASLVGLEKGVLYALQNGISTVGGHVDDAAFTVGTTKVEPVAGVYKSTRDSVDDGDAGALAMNAKRGLYVSPESPNGDSLVDDTNDLLKVAVIPGQNGITAGAGAVAANTPRTTLASDDPAVAVLGATNGAAVVTDVDGTIQRYLRGLVKFFADALGAGTAAAAHRVVLATDTTVPNVTGNVASGATDSGNPVKVGAKYNATLPTLTDGQRGDAQIGTRGSWNVTLFGQDSTSAVSNTNSSSDALATTGMYLGVLARGYVFNGTTWDRLRGDTTGTWTVGNVASGATDSGNPVKVGGKYNSTKPTLTDGQRGDAQLTTRGMLGVTLYGDDSATSPSVFSGGTDGSSNTTNLLGTASYGKVYNGATWDRNVKPNATSRIVSSAATTNATSAKASAGNLHKVIGYNARTSAVYLKFYNKASAPTVGTDTPVLTLYLPALVAFDLDFSSLYFSTGIAYGLTTDNADAGTTAVAAGDILGLNVVYS